MGGLRRTCHQPSNQALRTNLTAQTNQSQCCETVPTIATKRLQSPLHHQQQHHRFITRWAGSAPKRTRSWSPARPNRHALFPPSTATQRSTTCTASRSMESRTAPARQQQPILWPSCRAATCWTPRTTCRLNPTSSPALARGCRCQRSGCSPTSPRAAQTPPGCTPRHRCSSTVRGAAVDVHTRTRCTVVACAGRPQQRVTSMQGHQGVLLLPIKAAAPAEPAAASAHHAVRMPCSKACRKQPQACHVTLCGTIHTGGLVIPAAGCVRHLSV